MIFKFKDVLTYQSRITLLTEKNPAPLEVGSFSHYLQQVLAPSKRWFFSPYDRSKPLDQGRPWSFSFVEAFFGILPEILPQLLLGEKKRSPSASPRKKKKKQWHQTTNKKNSISSNPNPKNKLIKAAQCTHIDLELHGVTVARNNQETTPTTFPSRISFINLFARLL